jgi:hypothetical protein
VTSTPEGEIAFGVELLGPFLEGHSFRQIELGDGSGSGGHSAWARYAKGNRTFEFHFRFGLGLVTYAVDLDAALHPDLIWALNAKDRAQHLSYHRQAEAQFRALLHDMESITIPFFALSEGEARALIIRAKSRPKGLKGLRHGAA